MYICFLKNLPYWTRVNLSLTQQIKAIHDLMTVCLILDQFTNDWLNNTSMKEVAHGPDWTLYIIRQ